MSSITQNFALLEFQARFYNHADGDTVNFVKGPREETITISYDPEVGMTVTQRTKFDEMKDGIRAASASCEDMTGEAFTDCVADAVYEDLVKIRQSKDEITKYRDLMTGKLRNYTCADPQMNTSKPLKTDLTAIGRDQFTVDTLFESTHANIWLIHDFITPAECKVLEDYGAPRLRRATVAAEDGTSTISEHRKAQQAGYELQSDPKNPLW